MAKQRQTNINIIYHVNDSEVAKSNALLDRASRATDNLRGSINKTKKSSDDLGRSLTKSGEDGTKAWLSFSNVLKTVSFVALAAAIGSVAKKIFDLGVKQQQTNIAFETFLGNADKAKKLIAELTKFSIITPFTPDQVNKAAKTLLAFGVTAEEIIPTLKFLGDVSAGTGKDLSEMAVIFGQIRSTGRLMGQDLLQLINAGFNPLQIISQKTGRSMKDLKKDMENGLISFDMVQDAFKTATSEGGLFFNLMEKQSKSIGGLLSTIEGNIEEIGKKLFEAREGGLAEFTETIADLTSNVDELAGAIDTFINIVGFIPIHVLKLLSFIAKSAKEAAAETAKLKNEELALQLALLEAELQSFQTTRSHAEKVKLIQKMVELRAQLGLKMPTTEDPLPWATKEKEEVAVGLVEALETKIKQLQEQIKRTTDTGDLGKNGLLVKQLKETQEALDKLLGKDTSSDKARKDALKEYQEQLKAEAKAEQDLYERTEAERKKRERDSAKNSADLKAYYYNLEKQKLQEAEDEKFRIMEAAARKRMALEQSIKDNAEMLVDSLINFAFTRREEDILGISDYYDKQIELAGDNDRAKKELEIKRERDLAAARERQKKADKDLAVKKIFIDGLVSVAKTFAEFGWPAGIIPAAIMAGITAVNAAQVSKYKDGGWIKGPGSGTSDSVPILASNGEFMVKQSAASKSPKILEQINSGKLNDKVLKEIASGRSGGSTTQIFDDKNILKKLDEVKNSQPDVKRVGNIMYETRVKTDTYKQWIMSKSMNIK